MGKNRGEGGTGVGTGGGKLGILEWGRSVGGVGGVAKAPAAYNVNVFLDYMQPATLIPVVSY